MQDRGTQLRQALAILAWLDERGDTLFTVVDLAAGFPEMHERSAARWLATLVAEDFVECVRSARIARFGPRPSCKAAYVRRIWLSRAESELPETPRVVSPKSRGRRKGPRSA